MLGRSEYVDVPGCSIEGAPGGRFGTGKKVVEEGWEKAPAGERLWRQLYWRIQLM